MRAPGGPSRRRWRRTLNIATVAALALVLIASVAVAFSVLPPSARAATGVTPVPGAAYTWGLNSSGQLGNGSTANQSAPVAVSLPQGVTITALAGGASHTLALGANGTVYAWGDNTLGQLGNGSTVAFSTTPVVVSVSASTQVTAIAAGGNDGLALAGGQVYAWGDNTDGALGNGTAGGFSATPVAVSLPASTSAIAIAAGSDHALALSATRVVYAWGSNQFGYLGNGTSVAYSATPVPVSVPAGLTVTAISDGGGHSLALDSAGSVYAWGDSRSGQLGSGLGDDYDNACNTPKDDKGTFFSDVPVQSQLPAGVTATNIAAGECGSVALAADGTLYAWGDDTYGELGNGATGADFKKPVAVHLPSGIRAAAVMTGQFHAGFIQAELEGTATPTTTTTLQGTNSSGQTFGLTIPPGAVVDPTTFTANEVAASSLPALPVGVTLVGLPESFQAVDDLSRDSVDHFGAQLTLSFSYPSSLGFSPVRTSSSGSSGQLTIAATDGTSWQAIPSTTSPTCCIILASVDHFTTYAVWLLPSPSGIENAVRQFYASGDINNRGIELSLLAKLQAAAKASAAGNCASAAKLYQAFINQVRAQTGQHIDATAANVLIPDAQFLIANCP